MHGGTLRQVTVPAELDPGIRHGLVIYTRRNGPISVAKLVRWSDTPVLVTCPVGGPVVARAVEREADRYPGRLHILTLTRQAAADYDEVGALRLTAELLGDRDRWPLLRRLESSISRLIPKKFRPAPTSPVDVLARSRFPGPAHLIVAIDCLGGGLPATRATVQSLARSPHYCYHTALL